MLALGKFQIGWEKGRSSVLTFLGPTRQVKSNDYSCFWMKSSLLSLIVSVSGMYTDVFKSTAELGIGGRDPEQVKMPESLLFYSKS